MNFGQALATFTGQNLGAGKQERVKKGMRATFIMSAIISVAVSCVVLFAGENLIKAFLDTSEPSYQKIVEVGKDYLIIVSSFYIIFSAMFTVNGVLRGAGDTLIPMFITLFSLWVVRIPMAVYLSRIMGEKGIWWAIPIAWFTGMIISYSYYRTGRWKKKMVINT